MMGGCEFNMGGGVGKGRESNRGRMGTIVIEQ